MEWRIEWNGVEWSGVVAQTNSHDRTHQEIVNQTLLRAGRLEVQLELRLPDEWGRQVDSEIYTYLVVCVR